MTRVALLLLLATVVVSSCSKEQSRHPLESVGLFVFDGKGPFLETGYDLVPETYYLFRHVGGTLCVQGERRCAPPRGSDIPGEESWGLKLLIDDQLVDVRDQLVLTVDETTPLTFYLPEGENQDFTEDKRALYEDNTGQWEVEVLAFEQAPEADWLQGANVTSYSALGYCGAGVREILKRLVSLGANAVQFVVVYETDSESIFPVDFSPRSYCLARATETAHELGLKVGWNLHVDPPGDGWRGELDPPDRGAFFDSYKAFARYYATLAEQYGVEILLPATEMVSLTRSKEDRDYWLSLFLELHGLFFGTIYYAADRSEYAELDSHFWHSCCDAVGITPWYKLSDKDAPTTPELVDAWHPIVKDLEAYANTMQMRLILAEGPGYRKIEQCAREPADYLVEADSSDLCQSEAYRAWMRTFTSARRQLINGYFIWELTVPGERLSDYTPLDSITEAVLKQGWKRDRR